MTRVGRLECSSKTLDWPAVRSDRKWDSKKRGERSGLGYLVSLGVAVGRGINEQVVWGVFPFFFLCGKERFRSSCKDPQSHTEPAALYPKQRQEKLLFSLFFHETIEMDTFFLISFFLQFLGTAHRTLFITRTGLVFAVLYHHSSIRPFLLSRFGLLTLMNRFLLWETFHFDISL